MFFEKGSTLGLCFKVHHSGTMRINVRVRVRVCNATATTRECYGVHMDVLPYHLSAHAVTGIDKDVKKTLQTS